MIKRLLSKSTYTQNVLVLMAGTGVAQAIPIAISPILTRLYTPTEFGVFALYMAIVSIVSVVVTGRYELAIILPKKDSDAINIVILAVALSLSLSLLLLVVVVLFNDDLTRLLKAPELSTWLYWVPASTMITGIYQSLNFWSNRRMHFKRLAISRGFQSASIAATQAGTGYLELGASGLVIGQVTGHTVSSALLAHQIYAEDRKYLNKVSVTHMAAVAKKYSNFPKYMILGQLANVASSYLPLFLLSAFFGSHVVGFYSLAQRILIAPMGLIAGALGDVYRQASARQYDEEGNCRVIFVNTLIKLLFISLFFVTPFFFFGPYMFSLVFGEAWREAGEIASIISVMIIFQTMSSPLSLTVLLANMQVFDLVWQVVRLLLSFLSLYIGYAYFDGYKMALVFFSLSFSFLYLVHTYFQYKVAKGELKK